MALQAVVGRTVAANAHIRMRVSSGCGSTTMDEAGYYIKWLPEHGTAPRASSVRGDTLPENAYSVYGAVSPAASQSPPRPHGRTRKTCCGVVKARKKMFFAGVVLLTALAGGWFVWQRVMSRSSASSNDGPVIDGDNHSPTTTTPTTTSTTPTHSPTTQHTAIVLPAPASSSASSPKPHVDRYPAVPVGSPSFLPSSSSDRQPHHPPTAISQPHSDPPPGTIPGITPIATSTSPPEPKAAPTNHQVFFGSFFI